MVLMTSRAHGLRVLRAAAAAGMFAVSAAGCATAEQDPQGEAAEQAREAQARQDRSGPVLALIEVARQDAFLSLEQEQALDELAAELEDDQEGFRALREQARAAAVAVVRAGAIEPGERDRLVAEGVAAIEEHVLRTMDAIEVVHAILEPDQRAAVADGLRARLDERFAETKKDHEARHRNGFARFASHLVLSEKQVDELAAARKELMGDADKLRPSREEMYGLVDAFASDDVRPAMDALHARVSRVLRARVARASDRADSVLSIFTPAQRDLLADLILEGPSKMILGEAAADHEG